jgi:hypothetical protein
LNGLGAAWIFGVHRVRVDVKHVSDGQHLPATTPFHVCLNEEKSAHYPIEGGDITVNLGLVKGLFSLEYLIRVGLPGCQAGTEQSAAGY